MFKFVYRSKFDFQYLDLFLQIILKKMCKTHIKGVGYTPQLEMLFCKFVKQAVLLFFFFTGFLLFICYLFFYLFLFQI